jgi:hypothetical protein
MKAFIAKAAIASGILLSLASTTVSAADSMSRYIPKEAGIVWVVLSPVPVYNSGMGTARYFAPFCVKWGAYNKCFGTSKGSTNEYVSDKMVNDNNNYFVVGFSNFGSTTSIRMDVTTSDIGNNGSARIISVSQGNQPYYNNAKILTCGRTIKC